MSAPPSPSGEARGAVRPPPGLLAFVAAVLLIRGVLAAIAPLTEDEAYYRLWSMAPAFGYYDHPPMIAWWIWAGRRLAGDTALGVRLGPVLASALDSLLVFDLAARLGAGREGAARAAVWYNAMFLVAAGGLLAVPDAPAALFWLVTLCCVARGLQRPGAAWWLAAGLAAGLAALSKYSALFLAPGVLAWLALTPDGRARLRTPGPWLAVVVAALVFSVNIAWNAQHQWLTFAKQFGRITPHQWRPRYLVELILAQALLINPVIAFMAIRALTSSVAPRARALWPMMASSLPFAAYLVIHALHDRVQAHWPAPLYGSIAVLAAAQADAAAARWARIAAPVTTVVIGALLLVWLVLPPGRLPRGADPALPLRGWPVFSRRIEAMRRDQGAAWIGATSYGLTAQLSAEPAIGAPLLQISERARWRDLRPGPAPDLSRPGLLVDLKRRIDRAALARCFTTVKALAEIVRGDEGEKGKVYSALLVSGPRGDLMRDGCPAAP